MFFFIGGNSRKKAGQERKQMLFHGQFVTAEITVYKNYITIFFIPLIPMGKNYTVYIPDTGEWYQDGLFSKLPPALADACREVGSRY